MASTLDTYYQVLFRPRSAFAEPRSFGAGTLTLLLVAAVSALGVGGTDGTGLWLVFLAIAATLLGSWLILGGIAYLLARAWHAPVEPGPFYAALALAFLPWLLAAPLDVVGQWGPVGAAIAGVGGLAVFVWWLAELVLAGRGAAQLGTGRAIGVLLLSAVLPWILPMLMMFFGMLGLIATLGS